MKNFITIPLTRDRKKNCIIIRESIVAIIDNSSKEYICTETKFGHQDVSERIDIIGSIGSKILHIVNGELRFIFSEFTSSELYEEICSHSK